MRITSVSFLKSFQAGDTWLIYTFELALMIRNTSIIQSTNEVVVFRADEG